MNPLDMRTVIFSYAVSNFVCMIVIAFLWVQNRRQFQGLGLWLADFGMQWAAVLLIALRGRVPDLLSMTGSNGLILGGTVLLYIGLGDFIGKRVPRVHNAALLAAIVTADIYFLYVQPNLTARSILFSLGLLAICAQCAWLLLCRHNRLVFSIPSVIGIIFALFCLVSLLRIAFDLASPVQTDFFQSGFYDTLSILTYQVLFILLTFGLFLMVNRRLVGDLSQDIAARKQAEEALRESEASFREVFDNTAHGIFIIDVTEDGDFRVGNSNRAEEIATTIRREDVIGKLLADAFPPEIARSLRANYSRAIEAGQAIAYEEDIDFPEVGRRHYLTTLAPVRDASGRFYRIIGSTLDITDRKRTEETLRLSEEKFHKAFHSSPDAILISRVSDGQLVEVNEGFSRIFGLSREEALANTTIHLGIWSRLQDREKIIADLHENRSVQNRELEFRNQSGKALTCLYSAETIFLDGQAHLLAILRDISEQKISERIIRLRLDLWEFASTHSLEQLVQRALDEIGELTTSPIGFYHFVEEDQNTLTLQAWSTRTLAEFCHAEAKGMHYPIAQAGVWVDCVRQRKPVIHNDYASLSHRKGLPDGHAEVVRELVVPILRDGRVVAILGVGNKPANYDQGDVDLVAFIADEIWTIVEQKRAGEQILQLNARLEQMAMTDDLTSLRNRRSFFRRGEEEIKRSQRYQNPLSLLMLDIDHFKQVNDAYGHETGDLVLQCMAHSLQDSIREIDLLARLGGEEFAILLPNTDPERAAQLGERLRSAVESGVCTSLNIDLNITVSIGVASYSQATPTLDAMLRMADQALYQAKSLGRNQVVYIG